MVTINPLLLLPCTPEVLNLPFVAYQMLNPRKPPHMEVARPRYFFRFNWTSAISDVPFICCDHVKFQESRRDEYSNRLICGKLSDNEWNSGPLYTHVPGSSRFIELDLIELSRYAIGINPQYRNPWEKIAFIAVDPENLNTPYYTPDFFEDHGDDVLPSYIAALWSPRMDLMVTRRTRRNRSSLAL